MATQQLMFDILASSKGVDKTFDGVVGSANSMAGKLAGEGDKAAKSLFGPLLGAIGGGSVVAALGEGIGSALNMDSAVREMTAGLALTGPAAETAGQVAGNMYANAYGGSMDDVTAAVGATMSSIKGMSTASEADLQTMTGKVMDLSKAFGIDTARAAQVAGQMITSGLAKDGTQAADLLAASLSKVPANVREDVLDAVDEYGPMFSQLGISGGAAMTMLVDASAKGAIGIDKTGDALKEFTIRATDMSKSSGDAYKTLGLNQGAMTRDLLAGGEKGQAAFGKITTALGNMKDPAAQSQAALALFGTPLEDLGTGGIPKFIDGLNNSQEALGKVEGASATLGDKINTGPGASFATFQRQAETSLGAIGAQILPILTPILANLTQFAPVIGPAVIALGALAAIMAVVNFVMALNPITWIIVGIVALIAAIVALVMNWDAVVNFISVVWGGFMNWLGVVIGGFVNWWNGVWAGFVGWTTGIWNGFTGMLTAVWNGFISWIMAVVTGFGSFIGGAFSGIVNFAVSVWSGLGSFFRGLWSGIINGVSSMVGGIGSFFSGMYGTVVGIFAGAGKWLWDAGVNIVNGLFEGIRSLAGTIGNFFLNLLPGWIVEPFKIALNIHSPSRVFAGFGENIGEGLLLGVGRTQARIDDRMAKLVTVPPVPDFDLGGGGIGARSGAGARAGYGGAGEQTVVHIAGNVYGDPEDIVQEINLSKRRASVVSGLRAVAAGV
jgi:phage-related minor tail protein